MRSKQTIVNKSNWHKSSWGSNCCTENKWEWHLDLPATQPKCYDVEFYLGSIFIFQVQNSAVSYFEVVNVCYLRKVYKRFLQSPKKKNITEKEIWQAKYISPPYRYKHDLELSTNLVTMGLIKSPIMQLYGKDYCLWSKSRPGLQFHSF